MDILELSENTRFGVLSLAERTLLSGGVVIAPTDTVYGILGNAADEEAIKKIFALKQRPEEKVFPIFVKDIAVARKLAYISDAKTKFLDKIWPGPVTVVFHHKGKLPEVLTGGVSTIGIRIPDYPFLSHLLSKFSSPLAQTSANIFGKPPAKDLDEIKEYFIGNEIKPDLIIDGGTINGQSSVVIDFTRDRPFVLRTGVLGPAELDDLLKFMG